MIIKVGVHLQQVGTLMPGTNLPTTPTLIRIMKVIETHSDLRGLIILRKRHFRGAKLTLRHKLRKKRNVGITCPYPRNTKRSFKILLVIFSVGLRRIKRKVTIRTLILEIR